MIIVFLAFSVEIMIVTSMHSLFFSLSLTPPILKSDFLSIGAFIMVVFKKYNASFVISTSKIVSYMILEPYLSVGIFFKFPSTPLQSLFVSYLDTDQWLEL